MSTQSSTSNRKGIESHPDVKQYRALENQSADLIKTLKKGVINHVAKTHFEKDRGEKVTQVLPGKTENYQFKTDNFEALILPDTREIINHVHRDTVLTSGTLLQNGFDFSTLLEDAHQLWENTYGEHEKHVTQPGHPGEFPLENIPDAVLAELQTKFTELTTDPSLELLIAVARDKKYKLLANLFNITESELFTPGGTDLSAIVHRDEIHVPYNDGEIAVLRPTHQNISLTSPMRGVIIGHDDTPTGIFAHVTDVTNLHPTQSITRDDIRDAMGFDSELDPWDPVDHLSVADGERIRIQGDLRIERTGEVESFTDEIERTTRQEQYNSIIENVLNRVTIPAEYVRGRDTDTPVSRVLRATVTESGDVSLEPVVSDSVLRLLAHATLLCELDVGSAKQYGTFSDIPHVAEPDLIRRTFATTSTTQALSETRTRTTTVLTTLLETREKEVEQTAKETARETEIQLDTPRQVNLPVDNHMTFIKEGHAPETDTEPVPVAVPTETTLHIVHGEHNTITVGLDPGVYSFSLLPRGLQPRGTRPTWGK